ncbi:hypothetical protein JXR93_13110 [bacterium]|nr:hypothetical protein [bacterium]
MRKNIFIIYFLLATSIFADKYLYDVVQKRYFFNNSLDIVADLKVETTYKPDIKSKNWWIYIHQPQLIFSLSVSECKSRDKNIKRLPIKPIESNKDDKDKKPTKKNSEIDSNNNDNCGQPPTKPISSNEKSKSTNILNEKDSKLESSEESCKAISQIELISKVSDDRYFFNWSDVENSFTINQNEIDKKNSVFSVDVKLIQYYCCGIMVHKERITLKIEKNSIKILNREEIKE